MGVTLLDMEISYILEEERYISVHEYVSVQG